MFKWSAASGAIILAVAVVAVATAGGFLLQGRSLPSGPNAHAPTVEAIETVAPPPEVIETPPLIALSRADMIASAQQAAAIYGAGGAPDSANRDLVGRRFVVNLPFGCLGPSTSSGAEPARWEFDARRRTAKLSAEPQVWTEASWISKITGAGKFSSVEGFWIARPWLVSDTCPKLQDQSPDAPPPSPAAPLAPPSQSMGLAAYVSSDAGASQRALRTYQAAIRPKPDSVATFGAEGFQLVLAGRVGRYADDAAIHCYSPSLDDRPVCLINVEIESVAFADVAAGTNLAEWRNR